MTNLTAPAKKIDHLFTLKKITPQDVEGLTPAEREYLAETSTKTLQELKGTERDNFLEKIDLIIPASTKNDIWAHNHSLINGAVSRLIRQNGVMPAKNIIARETGLSRQTVAKHIKEYKRHPEYTAEMEQFKFMATNLLAGIYKQALNGDMRAAKLYFEMVGIAGNQQAETIINEQNNYIQVNNTILSQENLEQLSAEQLNQIENIITNKEYQKVS